jgi:hypothetical protein
MISISIQQIFPRYKLRFSGCVQKLNQQLVNSYFKSMSSNFLAYVWQYVGNHYTPIWTRPLWFCRLGLGIISIIYESFRLFIYGLLRSTTWGSNGPALPKPDRSTIVCRFIKLVSACYTLSSTRSAWWPLSTV